MRGPISGLQRDRPPEGVDRRVGFTKLLQDAAQAVPCLRQSCIHLHSLPESGPGLAEAPRRQQRRPKIGKCRRLGIEAHSFTQMGDGLIEGAQRRSKISQVDPGRSVVRTQRNGTPQVPERLLLPAAVLQGRPQVVVRLRQIRSEPDRRAELFNSLPQVAPGRSLDTGLQRRHGLGK